MLYHNKEIVSKVNLSYFFTLYKTLLAELIIYILLHYCVKEIKVLTSIALTPKQNQRISLY